MKDYATARSEIAALVRSAPKSDATYVRAADILDSVDQSGLPEIRLAILRSFTIEPLVEVLRVKGFLEGLRVQLFLSEFSQYEQEIRDLGSRFYAFNPDITFVALRLEDVCPRLFKGFVGAKPDEVKSIQSEVAASVLGWVEGISARSSTEILLANFVVPAPGALGIFDSQTACGQVSVIRAVNAELVGLAERLPQFHVVDVELLASRVGKDAFFDRRQLYRASNPYRLAAYADYGEFLMTHIRALLGRRRKCLVLDLDGTLWGGLVGDDGPSGIELSDEYPGNCFKDFQHAVLALHRRGVILAINSKNNYEDAIEVIRSHPEMVLREEHFSAVRINWRDKVENLQEIARELDLGLESFVFVDDSAAECERVRTGCPEVLVVQLPAECHAYRSVVEDLSCFEQLTLTQEDRARGELYRARSKREKLAQQAASLEDFLASLAMRGRLYRNEASHIPRISQMTLKTNQFNLTTKRCTEGEIARLMEQGCVYSLQIEDRFGDNGIVGAALVVRNRASDWEILNLLLSCRVIMRTIEDTLVAEIAADAKMAGARGLVGVYVPSLKNRIAAKLYERLGFSARSHDDAGRGEWVLDLVNGGGVAPSPWVRVMRMGGRSGCGSG